jgi:ubiquinone/menaquinone biosynthesis C-methylase UbiE
MSWPLLIIGALTLAAFAALLHWQINLAEGVYLGRRVVIWLYDRFAPRYDVVKSFSEKDEAWFLGAPLAKTLRGVSSAIVLDVATGTGRLPLALFRQPDFAGRIIALDLSRHMLALAAQKSAPYLDRLTLLWQDATILPFRDDRFDAVTCLEALEFLPDGRATVAEMARVLRPGGVLLTSNRIGPGARWMPGRTTDREQLTAMLASLHFEDIGFAVWQVDYDIVWARKRLAIGAARPAHDTNGSPATLPHLLRCSRCANSPLERRENAFCCTRCGSHFRIAEDGVIEMGF